ncbi:uncharacterized protein [Solanum tuberosum]|uniref:uncharacterized protein n=1 Tax=Solanum tuberosum TaxID=4113 RepID=UPI00073A4EA2|nr:PREDICTED: uncharacterized protein LOC107063427 [Solanum tuberosum]
MARPREAIAECLSELQSESQENQQKALLTLVSITKVSPQNRNLLAQTNGVVSTLLSLSMSPSSTTIQLLALSILFNLSLNPNLKQTLADMEKILFLNSVIMSSTSAEPSRIAASLLCSLAMLDKNKAKFGVAGTVEALVKVISRSRGPASHHFLSTLAELVQFHGNCTVAVQSGAVPVLIKLVEDSDCEDLAGTSLAILCLLARFEEGLTALKEIDKIVALLIEILKGKCMLSKEGAADILLRLFEESEGCIRDALRLPEFSSVLADLSVRGSVKAREKASLLMKKLMEANMDVVYGDTGNKTAAYLQCNEDFVGEIVSERFSVSRRRFDGGDYGEEMQDPKDYVKKIGFGSQQDPDLGPEQQLGLGGVSFYLSFVGVAIVCSLLALVV